MLPVPGILRFCNHLQNVGATTYIVGLQLSTFIFYNKHVAANSVAMSYTQLTFTFTTNDGSILWNYITEEQDNINLFLNLLLKAAVIKNNK